VQKLFDHRDEESRVRGEREVPAAVDVQPRVRDQGSEQPPVDRRDEGVVVAGEYQRRLAEAV
jgi:hypothetical protein